MKFASFLNKFQNSNDHIKLAYSIATGNHSFPSHLGSKSAIFNWCHKNIVDEKILESMNLAWNEFESKPFATTTGKNSRKKLRKYID